MGLAAVLAASFAGPALAEDQTEEIQEDEQPGSEIELNIGGGKATMERENGAPLFAPNAVPQLAPNRALAAPDDPDTPQAGDPIDNALPGEGPESLSGPDDDDNLPD
jgi:hypothetical protein